MGARDIVRREMGALTQREQREAPQEHLVVDPTTGQESATELTPEVVADIEAGRRQLSPGDSVRVQLDDGSVHRVSGADAQAALARGARLLGVREERREAHEATLEQAYGDRPVMAALHGMARGATLGVSDLIARGMGYDEAVAEVAKRSPQAALAGELVLAVAPAIISGGSSTAAQVAARTPAGLVTRGGAAIAAKGTGRGLLARTAAKTAGGAFEGAAFNVGGGVSELALSEDPITLERAGSVLSSRALYGGAIGGGIGGGISLAGAAADKGLRAGRKLLDDYGAQTRQAAGVSDDLARLDRAGLRAAKEAEIEMLGKAAVAEKAAIADDIAKYRDLTDESRIFVSTDDMGLRKELADQQRAFRRHLGNPKGLQEYPKRALDTLQREENALNKVLQGGDDAAARFAREEAVMSREVGDLLDAARASGKTTTTTDRDLLDLVDSYLGRPDPTKPLPLNRRSVLGKRYRELFDVPANDRGGVVLMEADLRRLRGVLEGGAPSSAVAETGTITITGRSARKYADWHNIKLTKETTKDGIEIGADDAALFRQALDSGDVAAIRRESQERLGDVLANNEALQARIAKAYETPTSERLAAIEAATEALSAKKPAGLFGLDTGGIVGGVVGHVLAGPMGAVGGAMAPKILDKLKSLIVGRLAKGATQAAERGQAAIDALMATGQKVARRAPPLATQVLTRVAYAPEGSRSRLARVAVPSGSKLVEAYRAREGELRSQTMMAPDGSIVMRPAARRALAEALHPVAVASSPLHADRLETAAARRIEFLASKLPKRPDMTGIGPDRFRPSDMEIRTFARYAAAVEDPQGVLERLADSTVTTEDAEALRTVYPEMFAAARAEILGRLPEIRQTMPYARRLAMSIFFGEPVDPSMDPRVIRILQGNFAAEIPGGGSPAMPSPQFGSVRKSAESEATQAQQRSQPRSA